VQEVQNIRALGWQRVVADLAGSVPDDRVYLLRLMATLGQVTGASQGVLLAMQAGSGDAPAPEVVPLQVWPLPGSLLDATGKLGVPIEQATDPARLDVKVIDRLKDVLSAARACAGDKQLRVFGVEDSGFYDAGAGGKQCVVAVPVPAGAPSESAQLPPRAIITLLVDGRSKQALQSQLALIELMVGYVFGHEAQQSLRRAKQAGASIELAARLLSSINTSENFKACTLQLVSDLCRMLSADRVSMGWLNGSPATWQGRTLPGATLKLSRRPIALRAISDTEHIDRRMELCRQLEGVMDECLDQEQAVLFPQPVAGAGGDTVLSQTIVHAHRELARNDASKSVASFPLRVVTGTGERFAGVVTVEASSDLGPADASGVRKRGLEPATVELVQATLDLIAPVLAVRASDDRTLPQRTLDSSLRAAAWAVGPRHTVWKVVGIATMLTTGVLFLGKTTYRVGAPMQMVAENRRMLVAPVEGQLLSLGEIAAPDGTTRKVESGASVQAGQLLAQMDTRELLLQLAEQEARLAQFEKQSDDALKRGDAPEAAESKYKADEARARVGLLQRQIEKSAIRAPIAGTIISGDIKDKLGATVKAGESLFEVADMGSVVVRARVSDRDIAFIEVGQTGEVSPKSDPSLAVPFRVVRITPLAQAADGENTFEVVGALDEQAMQQAEPNVPHATNLFLVNQEGQAKFNTQRRTFAWILSRRVIDQLKIWLWW
jgi:hypothetical protein